MIEHYEDLEIRIGMERDGAHPLEVDSPAGEASGTFCLPFDAQELGEIMERVQSFDTDQDFLKEIGGRLYQALFTGPFKTLLAESLGMCGEEKGLRLRLRIGPPELATLPWEFLYDEEKGKFLALLPQTLLTRHIAVLEPTHSLKAQQIRVAVVIASPKKLPPLDIEKEKQRLFEALGPLIEQKLAHVEFLEGATMSRLMDKLREKFNVLHFIGHGDLDEGTGQGYLCFEDEWGGTNLVDGQTLGHLLEDTSVRLVTLNACESARLAEREARLSMAPALLSAGVPAVVAMQTEIPDETAVIFAREFYRSLAFNRPVGAALTEARNVIQSTLGIENVDWAIPVLYDRSVDGRILDLERPKTWREAWLSPRRLVILGVALVAFVATLFAAIPGVQQFLPTPAPMPTHLPTATPLAFPVAEENEVLVVVTQFDRRGGQEFDASQRVFNHLQEALQMVTATKPRVEQINEVVADSEAAKRLGRVYGATLVIWGWYDDMGITPNLEVVPTTEDVQRVTLGEFVALPSQPDKFVLYVTKDLPRGMTYLSSFTIGQICCSQQEWEAALEFANLAIEIVPEMAENIPEGARRPENLHVLRGNIYEGLGEHEKAIADFDQAIAANPDYAHAYVGRGAAYVNLMQIEAAINDLDRAIQLDPDISRAYYNRGMVNFLLDKLDNALLDLNRAIELDPAHANAYWVRGYTYYYLGDMTQALADMDRMVSLVPDSPVGYVARGGMCGLINEYEKAEADLRKALEMNPDHLEGNINLGWVNFLQQKYAEAIRFFEKAIAIDPKRTEPRFNMAACLLALGQTEQALAENRTAIAINASPLKARSAIDDLEWLRQVQPDTPGLDQMIQEIQASLEKLE
jgi:tetratricopeptide (TPR) repeat protein